MPKSNLPHQPQVGDKVRLKAERITPYMAASKIAGYDLDPYAVREVVGRDPFAPGGGDRLHVQGAPFMFLPRDVTLAWSTELERREMLLGRGWKFEEKTETWKAPK